MPPRAIIISAPDSTASRPAEAVSLAGSMYMATSRLAVSQTIFCASASIFGVEAIKAYFAICSHLFLTG